MIGLPVPAQINGMGPTDLTNLSGMMTEELKAEVTKYGDFAQLTYPNFIHFGEGNPQIANPAELLPWALSYSHNPAVGPSWITPDSPIYGYEILEDDRYYLEATSGIYRGEFGYTTRLIRKYLPFLLGLLNGGDNNAPESRNWIGYVAVSKPLKERNGERDLVVVFRGTQAKAEWISNIVCDMVEWSELQTYGPTIKVERGFETIYRRFDSSPGNTVSIQGQVHVAVRALLAKYQDDKDNGAITSITTAGHSLGGALACMCAFDLAWSKVGRLGDKQDGDLIPITAFTFEAPRVGNPAFAAVFATQRAGIPDAEDPLHNYIPLKSLRVYNTPDIVPKVPCSPFALRYLLPWLWWKGFRFILGTLVSLLKASDDEIPDWLLGFRHAGREYRVNTEPMWDWLGWPPAFPKYNNWWWPPKGPGWWLSRIGQLHSLQLPLYLIDPTRGMNIG
ncbi:hypothetical protein CVIRNUC_010310 [Coccomyxa viridis]|uniref:Fungal lipase-type domain-containing protein n=1 Tax=Coccomyxa viridis TaxID=1274662 RepID=A0AAV1IID3_9CHLO|nr:hypothetical protein CVIRNUC_010310 [Coccomyxa viridis]